ncbi:hypothetical protein G9A89_004656 [Geosiphon pyriformis]|nr:hypothetical protein G9A89_004656 [Geosiphon pyriformis]
MAEKDIASFEKLLYTLLERKPPGTSASKIKDLTRIAMTSPKQYKNIAHSVQKFIQRCAPDYKLGGLYVLDSISQAAARQKTTDKEGDLGVAWSGVEYLERFEKTLDEMFSNIMQCPEHDKEKVKRVLEIWLKKSGIYKEEVLLAIKEKFFSENASSATVDLYANGNAVLTANERDPRLRNTTSNQTTVLPTTLDSNALLATLNTITQGNLNIPDFLANPITSSSQPNNTNVHNNIVAANSIPQPLAVSAIPPYPNMNVVSMQGPPNGMAQPSIPPPMFSQPLLSSSNHPPNPQPAITDPSQFDYGDMDLEVPTGTNRGYNGPPEALRSSSNIPANQQVTSTAANSGSTSQFHPEQFNVMANHFYSPQQPAQPQQTSGIEPNNSIHLVTTNPPQNGQAPNQGISQNNNMASNSQIQYLPPPPAMQPWAPVPPQRPGSMPGPPGATDNQHGAPTLFPGAAWNDNNSSGYQNFPPPPGWNPNALPPQMNGPSFHPPPPGISPPPLGQAPHTAPQQHFSPNALQPHLGPPPTITDSPHQRPPPRHHEGPPIHQGPAAGHPDGPPMLHGLPHGHHEGPPMLHGPPMGHPEGPPMHHGPPFGHEVMHPEHQPPPFDENGFLAYEDTTIPKDCIRVLSRTLYVGNVMPEMSYEQIESIFAKHGKVSTVTINYDKSNAFVKMGNRAATLRALMAEGGSEITKLEVRWGVGFGPKDCYNFKIGESVIPLARLTETDKRWLTTTGVGGTGGRALIGGVAVEEPDIVIGEGPSSGSSKNNKRQFPHFEDHHPHHNNSRTGRKDWHKKDKNWNRDRDQEWYRDRDRDRDWDRSRSPPSRRMRRGSADSYEGRDRPDDRTYNPSSSRKLSDTSWEPNPPSPRRPPRVPPTQDSVRSWGSEDPQQQNQAVPPPHQGPPSSEQLQYSPPANVPPFGTPQQLHPPHGFTPSGPPIEATRPTDPQTNIISQLPEYPSPETRLLLFGKSKKQTTPPPTATPIQHSPTMPPGISLSNYSVPLQPPPPAIPNFNSTNPPPPPTIEQLQKQFAEMDQRSISVPALGLVSGPPNEQFRSDSAAPKRRTRWDKQSKG